MMEFRKDATDEMKENYQGIVQTVWSSAANYLDGFYGKTNEKGETPWECFTAVFPKK
jgi:hypothetical protein